MLVVFDSGIYVSALQFGGVPEQALLHAVANASLLYCSLIEDEVVRVMSDKFNAQPNNVRRLLSAFWANATRVILSSSVAGVCRDPKDDFLLECAVTDHADLIVTGDKDLLTLKTFSTVRIISPRQYLDEFARLR